MSRGDFAYKELKLNELLVDGYICIKYNWENEIDIYVESRGNIIGSKSWKNK